MNTIRTSIILLTLLLSSTLSATVIDFEDYSAGTIIDNEYSSDGVTILGVNNIRGASNLATIFDSTSWTGGDSDLGGLFSNGGARNYNPGNILIVHEHPNECNGITCTDPDDEGDRSRDPDVASVSFLFTFDSAVLLNSLDFFDIEDLENDGYNLYNAIRLFDINGAEMNAGTFFVQGTGGNNTWNQQLFGVSGVKSLLVNLGGSGAIDNLDFTTTTVPEPNSVLLLIIGLLLLIVARPALPARVMAKVSQ